MHVCIINVILELHDDNYVGIEWSGPWLFYLKLAALGFSDKNTLYIDS